MVFTRSLFEFTRITSTRTTTRCIERTTVRNWDLEGDSFVGDVLGWVETPALGTRRAGFGPNSPSIVQRTGTATRRLGWKCRCVHMLNRVVGKKNGGKRSPFGWSKLRRFRRGQVLYDQNIATTMIASRFLKRYVLWMGQFL